LAVADWPRAMAGSPVALLHAADRESAITRCGIVVAESDGVGSPREEAMVGEEASRMTVFDSSFLEKPAERLFRMMPCQQWSTCRS
jgi:hypothetical protein